MKTIQFLFKIKIQFLAFLLLSTSLNAQLFNDKQVIVKSYPVNTGTNLDINNKYGKVHIINWQKDSVKIEVEVFYRSNSFSKLQKAKDGLSFSFTGTIHFINAATIFGSSKTVFSETMKNISETFISDNSLEINYTVYMPDYINLKVVNKYGDFYIDNHKGNLNLNLSNGNIKINEIVGNATIVHKFGNATIGRLSTASFNGSYSELQLKTAEQLSLETKSGTVYIENVNILKIQSRRDKISINNANNVYGSTYFSDGNFQLIKKELNLNTHYGVFNFYSLPAGMSFINLIAKYSDFNLFFESGASYTVDFKLKNTSFMYPINSFKIEESYNEKEKTTSYSGVAGNGIKSLSFKIVAENGSIVISHK
ncbi:MAG: hypothetical protein JXR58_13325 [Bacteroidales bacterium]|nr:hypothetical protein [Bacteroidales bacterium]